jgi:hypothetical protein
MLAKAALRGGGLSLRSRGVGRRWSHDESTPVDTSKIPRIPAKELRAAALAAGIPAIFFGFSDNFIMLVGACGAV